LLLGAVRSIPPAPPSAALPLTRRNGGYRRSDPHVKRNPAWVPRGGHSPPCRDAGGRRGTRDNCAVISDGVRSMGRNERTSVGSIDRSYAAKDADGLWAGAGHSPRWVRIFAITVCRSMKAMIRVAPPHWGHTRGSASYTGLISRAHARSHSR